MYVLRKIVVNSMNNITFTKDGGADMWHERREHHRDCRWYREKTPGRKGVEASQM